MNTFKFFLLLSIFVISTNAYAQGQARTTISVGTNVSIFKIRDTGMSSAPYNGLIPGVQMQVERRKDNSISYLSFSGDKGILTPKGEKDGKIGKVNQNGFDFNYSYLRKFYSTDQGWSAYAGLQIGSMIRHRLHNKLVNSSRTFENINYVGPAFYVIKNIEMFGNPLELNARFNVPAFAAVLRPSITNLGDFLGRRQREFEDRFREHGFTSFDNLLMLQSEISLKYQLREVDAIKLNYSWQFIEYTKPNSFQSANHFIGISYVRSFRSKSKEKAEEEK